MHRDDLRRMLLVTLLSAAAGWLSGELLLCLWLGAVGYILWQQRRLERLLQWMRGRREEAKGLDQGVVGELLDHCELRQERYRKRKKKLSNMLKQFQKATRALPDATVVLDGDGAITWSNPRAERLLGVQWPRDGGRRIASIVRHPAVVRLLRQQDQAEAGEEMPSPVDPTRVLNLRLVPYGKGQRLLVARDVTEVVQAARVRSDFVANASHELRTPLTVLSGYLETLTEGELPPPERLLPLLQKMRQQCGRMRHMVEELLLLSRLEQCEAEPVREAVDVSLLLAEIQQQAMELGGDARHLFYLEADHRLGLTGCPSELHAAFANLVFNAVQYTPPGGTIRIRWYGDEQGAHLVVRDTGIGIPAHHLPRLTERFYRVDDSRAREDGSGGTGLGLAIVKHVLQRHGARLVIESEEGKGSTFRCDFPPESVVELDREETPARAEAD
ncbi:MAG: phosphate regulon sensor histidine kinase PhoR [Gammaproteobacteria bacterium]|nr:MAG: phosphate regulon sensor histidine kinase PhoR [Gammaproteobacteria bacterium]